MEFGELWVSCVTQLQSFHEEPLLNLSVKPKLILGIMGHANMSPEESRKPSSDTDLMILWLVHGERKGCLMLWSLWSYGKFLQVTDDIDPTTVSQFCHFTSARKILVDLAMPNFIESVVVFSNLAVDKTD
jgi:hypothetical protein